MFNLFKKKEVREVVLKSICNGKVIPIDQVEDKMFANKLLGDGVGFKFSDDTIYSPCEGTICMVAPTKHAVGIKCENDAELLIHCGLDTVNLNGEGLTCFVKENQKVKTGDKLLQVDVKLMKEKNICLTTPMIVTNGSDYSLEIIKNDGDITLSDDIVKVSKNI